MHVGKQLKYVRIGFSKVAIEGDSLSMVKKCNQEKPDKSEIYAYIHNIKSLSHGFQRICFQHINRRENSLADILAKEGLQKKKEFYLLDFIPSCA